MRIILSRHPKYLWSLTNLVFIPSPYNSSPKSLSTHVLHRLTWNSERFHGSKELGLKTKAVSRGLPNAIPHSPTLGRTISSLCHSSCCRLDIKLLHAFSNAYIYRKLRHSTDFPGLCISVLDVYVLGAIMKH